MLAGHDVLTRAACRGAAWWPWPGRTPPGDETWALALDVCGRCRCRRSCAVLALTQPRDALCGVWAGVYVSDRDDRGRGLLRRVARGERVTMKVPVQLRLALT